jgi:hypothetical protein
MDLGWARFATAPLTLLIAGAVATVTLYHQLPQVEATMDRALERRPQSFYEASFSNPGAMCDLDRERAWVGVRIRAVGGAHEVAWRIGSSVAEDDVTWGTVRLAPGESRHVFARLPIDARESTTVTFSTSDREHDLRHRCGTPQGGR